MNAAEALRKVETVQDKYNNSGDYDELALDLRILATEIRENLSGTSRLEPTFKQAADIYHKLYTEAATLDYRQTLELNVPRVIN